MCTNASPDASFQRAHVRALLGCDGCHVHTWVPMGVRRNVVNFLGRGSICGKDDESWGGPWRTKSRKFALALVGDDATTSQRVPMLNRDAFADSMRILTMTRRADSLMRSRCGVQSSFGG